MAGPIRVLQVFAQMNRGGAETMIMNLYRNIDRSKVQFDFIVHTEAKCAFDNEIYTLGGKIFRIPRYTGKNHFRYKNEWHDFLKEHPEYKIIHGHVRSTAAIYLSIAGKYGLTTIAHSHSTSSGKGFAAFAKNILQYPIRNTANYLFACSKPAGEWLFGKSACKHENFTVLNNAIDAKKFVFNENIRCIKRNEFHVKDKFVVGHVGRFHPQKNHEFLIDIFKEVYSKNKDSVLLLVGDGEERKKVQELVRCLGLTDCVIFAGIRSDVSEIFQAMDVFLFPSIHEGLPVTLVEAQASGIKCIISDTIAEEVKITNQVEFISLKQSPEFWAEQALKYVNGYVRENTYKDIADAKYDIKDNAKWVEEFYLNVY